MRSHTPRSSRARRRHPNRPSANQSVPVPAGWPDPETVATAVDANTLAAEFLAQMKPATMRMILQRMDPKERKAVLEPRNVPSAKVSLRAAGQVLALARAEEKPAESPLLGMLLDPASDLFNDTVIRTAQITAMRMSLPDLAMQVIVHNEQFFQGIRTWHRWADVSFEDLALTVVIGFRCPNAAYAAAWLGASYPEISQRYESLRDEYPNMPTTASARITQSNPLTRYMAARPDRKLPASSYEMHAMLQEDSHTRQMETERAHNTFRSVMDFGRRQRGPATDTPPDPDATANHEEAAVAATPPSTSEVEPNISWSHTVPADATAVPGIMEWATAVSRARSLSKKLSAGELPQLSELAEIVSLRLRLDNMSALLTHVLGQPVIASRTDIDRALTLILADPDAAATLGEIPNNAAEAAARSAAIPPASRAAPGSEPASADNTVSPPSDDFVAGSAAAESTTAADASATTDLSDLDAILHGELGSRLAALASASDEPHSTDDALPAPKPHTPAQTGDAQLTVSASMDTAKTQQPAQLSAAMHELVAAAMNVRDPGGELANDYGLVAERIRNGELSIDPALSPLVICTALPMALIGASQSGSAELLEIDSPALAQHPHVQQLREAVLQLCHKGVSLFDPGVRRIAELMDRWDKCQHRAKQLQATATTRTLKYEKATKIYQCWMAPGGRLHDLVTALCDTRDSATISKLRDRCRKIEATRAIDDTAKDLFEVGKPRIIASARKSLVDKYNEVLSEADAVIEISEQLENEKAADRSAMWRFELVTKFTADVAELRPRIHEELRRSVPHPWIRPLVTRVLDIVADSRSLRGPEIAVERARKQVDIDSCPVSS